MGSEYAVKGLRNSLDDVGSFGQAAAVNDCAADGLS